MMFDDILGTHRVMAILRGLPPAETIAIACRAWDLGIDVVEVPIGSPEQVESLAATVRVGAGRGKLVGAGTVVSVDHVRSALDAGARFTVAPGFDREVLSASESVGLPHLPGVATATEVHQARLAGCRWLKAFPAAALGPAWFSAIRGPFPDLHFVATGGLTAQAAPDFLAAGARVVAVGAALAEPAQAELLARLVDRV
jgi:2-dehydro-3-deoxyphosphogluconate aldolase/(4S)-4-hydroxy-2-oxoglutarate aldolase